MDMTTYAVRPHSFLPQPLYTLKKGSNQDPFFSCMGLKEGERQVYLLIKGDLSPE